jgi:acetyl esterase/lipase
LDYYLSPLNAPEKLIKKLPKTRLFVGSKDVLRDQSWQFVEKLYNAGVDAYLYSFDHCVHGMLNVAVETNVSAKIWHTVLISCITIFMMEKPKHQEPSKNTQPQDQQDSPRANPSNTILDADTVGPPQN